MAITVTVTNTEPLGNSTVYFGTIALDNSYPTGGEAVDLGSNERIDRLEVTGGKSGYQFSWDSANQKLIVYQGDNTNAAAAPAVQVPNATDLSALSALEFVGFGQ